MRTFAVLPTQVTDSELDKLWQSIDWAQVEKTVSNLQTRIARAALNNRWHEVNKLIRLITRSYHAKLLAVRQVTTSKGKKTPGVDGIVWISNADKMREVPSLNARRYRTLPLRRINIPKKNGKLRPLSIPTFRDRAMQALFAFALAPVEYATGDRSSFGFRKYRSTKDACQQAFNCLGNKNSAQWVLEADIKSCFDMISHDWLLTHIPMKTSILKQFLKAGFMEGDRLFPTIAGTPQGGVISPILANMVLNGFENLLGKRFCSNKKGTISKNYNKHKVNFIRYADDVVITADSEETAEEIKEILSGFLSERGLQLSEEKTRITHISEGFTFLGWEFRKFRNKLLIKPSKKSIRTYTEKVHDILRKGKSWTQDAIIGSINPITRGWSNYHNHAVASRTFSKLDYITFNMLYSWAKRRHPNEPRKDTVNKYWCQKGSRKWVFATKIQELIPLSKTKIRRHYMVKLDKNPFLDFEYFEERRKYKAFW
ncbi:group II intron reverse transcriptase/maturase [Methanoplanus endosymbiosus]|uniref:Group II intron reverse transcriptase/maturase n=1 Tax=Methanoplanus endosymbiosus TaxID=33865 RepID=A0A9E7PLD0_9EURY|nr:group II intron reverse transcriptase/maturase [Methanoplanus endosymbiosus]UUX92253.1 group II intron reverse transcriptase/maturase [Methanoplanus endosymbiosus]